MNVLRQIWSWLREPIRPCMPLHIREQYVRGFLKHNRVCRAIRYSYRRLRLRYWKWCGYYPWLPERLKKIEDD